MFQERQGKFQDSSSSVNFSRRIHCWPPWDHQERSSWLKNELFNNRALEKANVISHYVEVYISNGKHHTCSELNAEFEFLLYCIVQRVLWYSLARIKIPS